jgi:hypothetical protein
MVESTQSNAVDGALKSTKSRVAKPPDAPDITGRSVFLAGSIEMGTAVDWQA